MESKAEKIKAICEKRNIYKSNSNTIFKYLPNDLIDKINIEAINKEVKGYKFKESEGDYLSYDFFQEDFNKYDYIYTRPYPTPMRENIFSTGEWCGGLFYNFGMDINNQWHRSYLKHILENTTNTDYPLFHNGNEIEAQDLINQWITRGEIPEYFSIYENHNLDCGDYQEGRYRKINGRADIDFSHSLLENEFQGRGQSNGFHYKIIEKNHEASKIVRKIYRRRKKCQRKFVIFLNGLTKIRVLKKIKRSPFIDNPQFKKYIGCHINCDWNSRQLVERRLRNYLAVCSEDIINRTDMSEAYWSIINKVWKNHYDPAEIKIRKRYLYKWENCKDKYEKIFWEVQLGRMFAWNLVAAHMNDKYSCPRAIYDVMENVKGSRCCQDNSWKSDYQALMEGSPLL